MDDSSANNEPIAESETLPTSRLRRYATRAALTAAGLAAVIGISYLLSLMGAIHGKELDASHFSGGTPVILTLLDSEFFMGLIFLITTSVFVYVLYLFWELHEVAVHKSEATTIRNFDAQELLVPNKEFITGRLLNCH
jgi:small-conductance mechanosensitive channel